VKLRAMWIKEDSKGSLKWPNISKFRSPNQSTKGSHNAEFEKRRTGRNRAHHGLPVENTTDCGGGPHGRAPATHGRVPLVHPIFSLFRATFRLPAVFALFCPYNADVPGLIQHPIHTEYTPFQSPFILSFRLVLERERGSGEELQGLWIRFYDRKDGARV